MSPQVFPLKLNRTIENQIALSFDSFSFYAARLWNILPLSIRTKAMPKSEQVKSEKARLAWFKAEIKNWILGRNKNGVATLPGVPFR